MSYRHPATKWTISIYYCFPQKWTWLKLILPNRLPSSIFFQPVSLEIIYN